MSILTDCLINKNYSCKPIWFMRQAGRYLPEFRKIRQHNQDFIKLCLNDVLCEEITLQPIKRFDLDAAIIFSDILIVPFAMGQSIDFKNQNGPKLSKFNLKKFMKTNKEEYLKILNPVYFAISKTRKNLDKNKSLICFVGSPWTVLTYMFNLNRNKFDNSDFNKSISQNDLNMIIEKLTDFLKHHIKKQIEAGADVVQIFDSWSGLLNQTNLEKYCYQPNKSLVDFCKKINVPSICFPKGIKENYKQFLDFVKPNGLNIDYNIDPLWAKQNLKNVCIQGGLNPSILLENDEKTLSEVEKYLKIFEDLPYIFNLGHGILPETNPLTIKKIVDRVRGGT